MNRTLSLHGLVSPVCMDVCVCRGGGVFEYVGLWTFMRDRKGERESESGHEVGISDLLLFLSIQGLKDE